MDEADEYYTPKSTLPTLRDQSSDWTWQMEAACDGHTELNWFDSQGRDRSRCKSICHTCVVRVQCLDFAIRNDAAAGIWGGLELQERRRLTKAV